MSIWLRACNGTGRTLFGVEHVVLINGLIFLAIFRLNRSLAAKQSRSDM